ncbi:hypothetical protein GTQ40_17145 [Flavobacteriaceae bacterium R38]|nr:hypothetical protein [Flavobacteriaceae bacterium R38]
MDKDKLIDNFLKGTLSDSERTLFDELIANDATFKEEVKLRQNLQKVAAFEDDAATRAMLVDFEAEHHQKQKRVPVKLWLVAASLALIISITYFTTQKSTADAQVLFTENFEPYRNVVHPIVRSTEQQDLRTEAFNHYEKGEYKEALVLFEKLFKEEKTPHYLFYKANALLRLNRPEEAIVALKAHLKTKDTLTQKSNWYLAMAYLKLNDLENAKKNLKIVIAQNKYNVKKAKILLTKLD